MPLNERDERALRLAIQELDYLRALRDEIERLQRVVFSRHAPLAEAAHRSADQILCAELVTRFESRPERLLAALQQRERAGASWTEALREAAGAIHSYHTTPLGAATRLQLFGERAVFLDPEARAWILEQSVDLAGQS